MNNEMNEKKAVTLEDLLMELVKEGKAVRIPIGKAAIQPDKAEANKEQEALKLDKPAGSSWPLSTSRISTFLWMSVWLPTILSSPTTSRKMPRKRSCRTSMWMRCLAQIKQNTGLCMKSILAVLEAEHKYLDSIWGTDDDDSDEEDNA